MKRINLKDKELTPLGKKVFGSIGLVLIAIILFIVITVSNNKKNEFKTVNDPQKAREVALSIAEKVGKIYELPDEVPTLATITSKKDLPSDPFYQKAEEGDKILIFQNAQKAIIYRPSTNKIIDVAIIAVAPTPTSIQEVAGTSVDATNSANTQIPAPRIIFQAQ